MYRRRAARRAFAVVVVLLVAAEAASAAPGYRYELNSDETYTPGTTFEFNGSNTGQGLTAPFEVSLYGSQLTQLFAHTRGFLQWGATFGNTRTCLPSETLANPTIFPFWATSGTQSASGSGYGIYTGTDGTAPNRRYIVEWRVFKPATMSSPALDRRFEVILYESSPVITTVYNTPGVSGADATIGVSAGPAGPHTEYSCGSTSIPGGGYRIDYIPDPRNLSPPAITGTVSMDERLDASTGTWDGTDPITYGFQWLRCDSVATTNCTAIPDADEASYTPGTADANRRLRVEVKATTMPFPYVYDDTARSAATAIVPPPPGGGDPGSGGPGSGDGQNAAPQITSLSVSPRRLTARNRRRGRILYGLSEAATTRLTVQKAAPGRRLGRRCVRPTRRNASAKKCKRFVPVRPALQHAGGLGANEVAFPARVGRRRLRVGAYRVVAVATDRGGLRSTPRAAPFRVR